jgi:surfactin synthase thioesterase subunit/acyl carrier protein
MLPSDFRNLDKLPVTATGKLDRKALEKKASLLNEKQLKILPKNEVEKKILEIWEKCLDYPVIGTDINFFEVGGNSIKATQILSSIFKELECNITLKDIFNNPTIIDLSRFILNKNEDKGLTVKLNKIDPNLPSLFFIPPIIGSSTIFRELATKINSHYSAYGLQYKGFDYEILFDTSIQEMAVTFVEEIKKINKDKVVSLLGYSMGVPIAFEMTKILENDGYDVNLIFIDRGIYDKSEQDNIDIDSINEILEMELKHWFKEINEVDLYRVRKLTYNSLRVLNEYEVKGEIKSKIMTIEASKNLERTDMKDWSNYTYGDFSHFYLEADHYGILSPENLSELSKLIIKVFSELYIAENEYSETKFSPGKT